MNRDVNISRAEFLRKIPNIFLEKFKPFWETENNLPVTPLSVSGEIRIARVNISRCLAWGQMECQLCYLACPLRDKAIEMREHKPVIIAAGCDGCAMCLDACKTINNTPALEMVPLSNAVGRGN